jgi:Tfp pilus assembly protein FimV
MHRLTQSIKGRRLVAVAVALGLFSSVSLAEPQNAERALAQLMKDVQRLQPALAQVKSEDGYYTTRRGDTVDMILKRMLPNMPVKKAILRQALVKANPHAFKRSNPNWMYANKRLRLPGAKDIHNVIFVEQSGRKNSKRDERLSWIKYP